MEDHLFIPRAVVETRRVGVKFIFNAEVAFGGKHYVLPGNPHTTRDAAELTADTLVAMMQTDMIAAARKHLVGLPTAKE